MGKGSTISDQIKEAAGMEVERHPVDQFFYDLCPKLSYSQRLGGYLFGGRGVRIRPENNLSFSV